MLQQRVYSEQSVPPAAAAAPEELLVEYSYPAFPCVWDHLPGTWAGVAAAVCQVKALLLLGVAGCVYFQWQCFCLLRGQLHLYARTMKRS